MAASLDKVRLSFLDSESKSILNKINERLDDLDQKLSFVTEFLIKNYIDNEDDEDATPCVKVNTIVILFLKAEE